MSRSRGRALRWLAAACVVGLGACRDSGLPDRNLPLQEARHREYGYAIYQPAPTNTPVAAAGRHWIGSLPIESIPDRMLVPIANADGRVLYSLRGRQAPFDRLYSPVGEGRWRPFVRLN